MVLRLARFSPHVHHTRIAPARWPSCHSSSIWYITSVRSAEFKRIEALGHGALSRVLRVKHRLDGTVSLVESLLPNLVAG